MISSLILALLFSADVGNIDLARYAGTWHEIARLPNRFQKKCVGDVTAHYELRDDGKIRVRNRCRIANGKVIEANGIARLAGNGKPNSILKVRFAPAFLSFIPQVWGDYQIRALAPDYSYAAVGSPDFRYLWILSRNSTMAPDTYHDLVEEMRRQGYAVDRLILSDPPDHNSRGH